MSIIRVSILLVLVLLSGSALAENLIDLNGFRLWQYKEAVDSHFKKPFKEFETESSLAKAYEVGKYAYMVFEFPKSDPYNISAIQITGYTRDMLPFKGLVLGDSAKKVVSVLGKPSEIVPLSDVKASRYDYPEGNYSIEVDDKGRLYSIRIRMLNAMLNDTDDSYKHWEEFVKAVKTKDKAKLLATLRPDMEVYKAGDVVSNKKRYSEFAKGKNADFYKLFFAQKDSVLEAIKNSEPTEEIRLSKGVGVGVVQKFYKSKILKEIVFFPYNGRLRVYEVAFR